MNQITIRTISLIVIAISCAYIALKFEETKEQGNLLNIEKAHPITSIKPPKYPEKSAEIGEEGEVTIEAKVIQIGKPSKVKITNSSGSKLLDAAAIEAVQNSLFIPKITKGEIEETSINVPIKFKIH